MSFRLPRLLLPALALVAAVAAFAPARRAHAQPIPIADARSQPAGSTVTVEGTVTRAFGQYARFQDASGPTGASALQIRQTGGPQSTAFQDAIADGTIQAGTVLRVTGTTSEFNGLLQINNDDLASFTVVRQDAPPPPQDVTLATLQTGGEDYESELVRVTGLSFTSSGDFGNGQTYTVEDASGTSFDLRVQGSGETELGGTPIPDGSFTYEGVIGQFDPAGAGEGFQLIPVLTTDLDASASFRFDRAFAIAQEPDAPSVTVEVRALNLAPGASASVTLDRTGAGRATLGTDVTGVTVPQTFTFTGPNPAPQTFTLSVADDGAEEGVERVEFTLASSDGDIAVPGQFTLWIQDDATAQTTLFDGTDGQALVDELVATFGDPTTLGYDIARDTLYGVVFNRGDVVEAFYTGLTVPIDPTQDPSSEAGNGGINTEHTWPRSRGADDEPALSNMHILVPARGDVNTSRSNYPYGEVPDADTDRWFFQDQTQSAPPATDIDLWSEVDDSPADREDRRFEPREAKKGDVARALFYFYTVYAGRADLNFYNAQESTLFQWHLDDPVDADEVRRTLQIASYQDNKPNPFVLDPTLVDRAYISGDGDPTGGLTPIATVRGQAPGTTVTVEGTVTRAFGSYARFQDASGPTGASALQIRQTGGPNSTAFQADIASGAIQAGTVLRVTGTTSEFRGLLQLNNDDLASYQIVRQDAPPAPQLVTLDVLTTSGEDYESELVRVEDLVFVGLDDPVFADGTTYTVEEGDGDSFDFRVQNPDETQLAGTPVPGQFDYEGVVGQFDPNDAGGGFQLIPVLTSDLISQGPAAPQGLSAAKPDEGQVALTWLANGEPDLDGYNVYRGTAPAPTDVLTTTGAADTTFTDTTVDNGTTYYYAVSAVNVSGQESPLSNEVEVTAGLPPASASRLRAVPSPGSIELRWAASPAADVSAYAIYRADSLSVDPDSLALYATTADAGTTFTDGSVTDGTDYIYRVQALDVDGFESGLTAPAISTPYATTVQTAALATFDRGADPEDPRNYALVGLPGTVDRSVAATLTGTAGADWRAFRDTGAESDFLAEFDGSEAFNFRPGRGFWIISTRPWEVEEDAQAVSLGADGAVALPLNAGWNIISNPLGVDVPWSLVEAANGADLQTLWQWSGGFVEAATFASARQGQAYYLFNGSVEDGEGVPVLTELRIPVPGTVPAEDALPSAPPTLALTATTLDGLTVGTVRLGLAPEDAPAATRRARAATPGRRAVTTRSRTTATRRTDATRRTTAVRRTDAAPVHDDLAPPLVFDDAPALRIAGGEAGRRRWLARTYRAADAPGHTVDLELRGTPGRTVTLTAHGFDALGGRAVRLVDLGTAQVHDLRADGTAQIPLRAATTTLRVVMGSDAYVAEETESVAPEAVELLPNYPNPFTQRTTLEYTLPEALPVRLQVYDILGRRVATLADERQTAGFHTVTWSPRGLASGVYLLRMQAGDQRFTRKLTLVR